MPVEVIVQDPPATVIVTPPVEQTVEVNQGGVKGDKGDQGEPGADSTVPGPQGEQGPKGDKGDTGAASTVPGPTGPSGAAGADGESVVVELVADADWPPAPDSNPLHWYVRVP